MDKGSVPKEYTCQKCKAKNDQVALYCTSCGEKLDRPAPTEDEMEDGWDLCGDDHVIQLMLHHKFCHRCGKKLADVPLLS